MSSRVNTIAWAALFVVGLSFSAFTLIGYFSGHSSLTVLAWDAFTLAPLLLMLRWPRLGMAAMILMSICGLATGLNQLGTSHYIEACAVALAVGLGHLRVAVVGTAVLGLTLASDIYLRSGEARALVVAIAGSAVIYLVVWAIGLGIRRVALAEAARVEALHREQRLAIAADLHDGVARELAALTLAGDAMASEPTPDTVAELVEGLRQANASLRAVTTVLRGTGALGLKALSAEEALAKGIKEVRSRHGVVEVSAETIAACAQLPPAVDIAAGRILAEALHNASKYADLTFPCVVVAERSATTLDLIVSNTIHQRARATQGGMGLMTMKMHADAVGGAIDSREQSGIWVCSVSLPLRDSGTGS
ncbi:MAG: hypothetical protein IPJ61_04410 [Tessaracoccus sp.]|uniref:sensor histidine kinase n=1 Tax=Tessaracoccus sp. TaxID=1971211 RepID=UPI001EC4A2FE|nr:histidine kinase [Tessaracoccus sp.]MBK7820319.1 hypothetical protein [Tessaracoccus sp.]